MSASNYFSLFGLPQDYNIDIDVVKASQRELQRRYHPDLFVTAEPAERKVAAQMSATINEAMNILTDPVKRAAYMLALVDVNADYDNTTIDDNDFLARQMGLREELDNLRNNNISSELQQQFIDIVGEQYKILQKDFSLLYKQEQFSEAQEVLAKLHFFSKLYSEASAALALPKR